MEYGLETAFTEYGEGLEDGNIKIIGAAKWIWLALMTDRPLYTRWTQVVSDTSNGQPPFVAQPGDWQVFRHVFARTSR